MKAQHDIDKPIRLTIVVPTRNRADLALRSLRSVLDGRGQQVRVVVSDNSNDERHRCELAAGIAEIADARLTLIRPPSELPMTEHWQWALGQALADSSTSHVLFLTDRMAFKRDGLHALLAAVKHFPSDVVSYTYDRIDDASHPVVFKPLPRSGAIYRMPSDRLLELSSRMVFYSCLPRMLNCVVPRGILESVQRTFGSVFDSVAPDFCFCYRVLATHPSIVYFDRSLLVNYAQDRSNGASVSRGIATRDSRDFMTAVGKRLNASSPLAEPVTVGNAIVNEYCAVRSTTGGSRLPPLEWNAYLTFLGKELDAFRDPEARRLGQEILRRHGWNPAETRWTNELRGMLVDAIVRLQRRRFPSLQAAFEFAVARPGRDRAWLARLVRRYGEPIAWGHALSDDR